MRKKVTTQGEAIRVAYFIAQQMGAKRIEGAKATFASKYNGKWRETEFRIEHAEFEVYATRTKHTYDNRIRDSYSYVIGLLPFAVWAAKHYPDAISWREQLRDPALVLGTLDPQGRKRIVLPPRMGLGSLARAVRAAESGAAA